MRLIDHNWNKLNYYKDKFIDNMMHICKNTSDNDDVAIIKAIHST